MFGSNDMIGCNQIDIGSLVLDEKSQKCVVLCPTLNAPENKKLGQINFTVKVAPFDDSMESQAVEGRHKGGKKILATVIGRVLSVKDLKAPAPPNKTRNTSVKMRFDKQKMATKVKKKSMFRKFEKLEF